MTRWIILDTAERTYAEALGIPLDEARVRIRELPWALHYVRDQRTPGLQIWRASRAHARVECVVEVRGTDRRLLEIISSDHRQRRRDHGYVVQVRDLAAGESWRTVGTPNNQREKADRFAERLRARALDVRVVEMGDPRAADARRRQRR